MPFPIFAAVAAGASLFGAVSSYNSSKDTASRQRELGRRNAQYISEETDEQIRRKRYEFNQIQGRTKAVQAASGLGGLTRDSYLSEMKKVQQNELSWIRRSGSSRASIARAGGQMAADQSLISGQTALWGGFANALGTFGPSFSNWYSGGAAKG